MTRYLKCIVMRFVGHYGDGIVIVPRKEIPDFSKGPNYGEKGINEDWKDLTWKQHQEKMYMIDKDFEPVGAFFFDIDFLKRCGFSHYYQE